MSGELIVALIAIISAGIAAIMSAIIPIKVSASKILLEAKIKAYTDFMSFIYEHMSDEAFDKVTKNNLSALVGQISLFLSRSNANKVQELATELSISVNNHFDQSIKDKAIINTIELIMRISVMLQDDLKKEKKLVKLF